MKIVITGARGQLGQALQVTLARHDIRAFDHAHLDITQLAAARRAIENAKPELIINAAAFNNVDGAENDPIAAYRGNALGPRNLAIVSAAHGIPLLHVSTDYVFDGTGIRPYHEFDRPNPQSVYGASKLAGEDAVRGLNPRHYIVRTAWLYHTVGRNFAHTICSLANQAEVRVVSDQYGSPTYAPHLALAIARLVTSKDYGTYHFAGQGGASWYEFAQALYQSLGMQTPIRPISTSEFPRPARRPAYSVLTTMQDPAILLPSWREGVVAFAAARQKEPEQS